ncbi:MAG: hypothetical protein AAF581_10275 [Planctomycetota bacterium]
MSKRAAYIALILIALTVLALALLVYMAPQERVRVVEGADFSCYRVRTTRLPQRVQLVNVRWRADDGTIVEHYIEDSVGQWIQFYGPQGEAEDMYGNGMPPDLRLAEHEVVEAIQWAEDYVRSAHAKGECELPPAWGEGRSN